MSFGLTGKSFVQHPRSMLDLNGSVALDFSQVKYAYATQLYIMQCKIGAFHIEAKRRRMMYWNLARMRRKLHDWLIIKAS
jgi:hypothetical protein